MKTYSELDKLLHRQFLSKNTLSDFFYERLVKKTYQANENYKNDRHIFVTGLARAGTTSLLNKIFSTGEIDSLVYKFMPFILSPKISKFYANNFFSQEANKFSQRFHNDGILINPNSPECLDEILWIKSKKNYMQTNLKTYDKISDKILDVYGYFLRSYSKNEANNRMLIKNNNHHIRLEALSSYFKNSKFLLVFRDPFYHAISLLSQHINFNNLQKKDPFILEYMNLIGHREFGLGMKPFIYKKSNNFFKLYSSEKLDYWIAQWIETYNWILESKITDNDNIHLISYEKLCQEKSYYKDICNLVGIKNYNKGRIFKLANRRNDKFNFDSSLLDKAVDIYNKLSSKAF